MAAAAAAADAVTSGRAGGRASIASPRVPGPHMRSGPRAQSTSRGAPRPASHRPACVHFVHSPATRLEGRASLAARAKGNHRLGAEDANARTANPLGLGPILGSSTVHTDTKCKQAKAPTSPS